MFALNRKKGIAGIAILAVAGGLTLGTVTPALAYGVTFGGGVCNGNNEYADVASRGTGNITHMLRDTGGWELPKTFVNGGQSRLRDFQPWQNHWYSGGSVSGDGATIGTLTCDPWGTGVTG
jgi:hypothetical protein